MWARAPRLVLGLGLLLAGGTALAADAAEQAKGLLGKMFNAAKSLNYQGIFVYTRGAKVESMRIVHRGNADGDAERLFSLSGPPREIIRNNQTVTCIFPENRSVVEKPRARRFFPETLPHPVDKLPEFYTLEVSQDDRVAGREAWQVTVKPRDKFRFGYQFSIDRDSHLLLKSAVLTAQGEPLEQVMFTSLDLNSEIGDALLQPTLTGEGYERNTSKVGPEQTEHESGKWAVAWLPPGFAMLEHQLNTIPSKRQPVHHMSFSDGLAALSVFIEKAEAPPADRVLGYSSMGAVSAFSTLYKTEDNEFQVTAVGEVPRATVHSVAMSVKRAP
jgi:sigma-E factor negative regulatory protein RseB